MIPSFPKFASVWSLVQARATLDGRIEAQALQLALYGKRLFQRPVFGGDLRKLSAAYLHLVSPEELLRSHTPFGSFCKLLSAEHEAAALAHVAEAGAFEPRRFFPGEIHGSLLTATSRWCPQCVDDDRREFGFPFWRVHHHLPGLRHCWTHGNTLVQSCIGERCRSTPLARFGLLPGEPCKCSPPKALTSEHPLGYRAYAALVHRLTVDPSFRLDSSQRLISHERSKCSTDRAAQHLLESWNCDSIATLSQRLECRVSEAQLARLSRGQELGCHPALLVAVSALRALSEVTTTASSKGHEERALTANDWSLVQATAARTGFPSSGALLLLEGETMSSLEARHAISTHQRARAFVALLPPHIRGRIKMAEAGRRQARDLHIRNSVAAQHRARAEVLLAQGVRSRGALNHQAGTTYKWLLHNDPLWLQENLPIRGSVKSDSTHEMERSRRRTTALAMKQQGIVSRRDLHKEPGSPFKWLLKNDRAWLEENFPKIGHRARAKAK